MPPKPCIFPDRRLAALLPLLAAIDRSRTGEQALAWVRTVVSHPHEYLAGIGLTPLSSPACRQTTPCLTRR